MRFLAAISLLEFCDLAVSNRIPALNALSLSGSVSGSSICILAAVFGSTSALPEATPSESLAGRVAGVSVVLESVRLSSASPPGAMGFSSGNRDDVKRPVIGSRQDYGP